jgi:hypothetical protein
MLSDSADKPTLISEDFIDALLFLLSIFYLLRYLWIVLVEMQRSASKLSSDSGPVPQGIVEYFLK